MARIRNLTGQKFGRLTAVSLYGKGVGGHYRWNCVCDCGSNRVVYSHKLTTKQTISCGCINAPRLAGVGAGRHRLHRAPEYRSWQAMKDRCLNPNAPNYRYYGARGITVCVRWVQSFSHFLADLGPRPPKHSLDRIDPHRGYSPENCRWLPISENCRNTSRRKPKQTA